MGFEAISLFDDASASVDEERVARPLGLVGLVIAACGGRLVAKKPAAGNIEPGVRLESLEGRKASSASPLSLPYLLACEAARLRLLVSALSAKPTAIASSMSLTPVCLSLTIFERIETVLGVWYIAFALRKRCSLCDRRPDSMLFL